MKFFVKVIKIGILYLFHVSRAVLTLLPKKGDLNLLKNWRTCCFINNRI